MGWRDEVEQQDRVIRASLQRYASPEHGDVYRHLSVITVQRLEHRRDYARVSEFVTAWVDRTADQDRI